MRSLEAVIREVPRFAALEDEHLGLLTGCAGNVRFLAGEQLFREGGVANTFWVVRSGTVAIEAFDAARGVLRIETIEAGELLGWSWLFPPYRWHFDACALSAVRATAFDGACLRQKCEDDPRLGYVLMELFAQVLMERLQSTRLRLLDVYGDGDPR
jgi:CRP-like cAMP-binding protein